MNLSPWIKTKGYEIQHLVTCFSRWWFQTFSCLPPFGEDSQFDYLFFQMGWFNHQLGNMFFIWNDWNVCKVLVETWVLVPGTWVIVCLRTMGSRSPHIWYLGGTSEVKVLLMVQKSGKQTSWGWVVYPIIYRALCIPGGARFLPSTVCCMLRFGVQPIDLLSRKGCKWLEKTTTLKHQPNSDSKDCSTMGFPPHRVGWTIISWLGWVLRGCQNVGQ